MRVKRLFGERYDIVAVLSGESCPAEEFILQGEASTRASREGLWSMMEYVAEHGFQNIPSSWVHEVSKPDKIYEFVKGPLRLFFFHGVGGQIAVCACGTRKSGQKVDRGMVAYAAECRRQYLDAVAWANLECIDETE